MDGDANSVHRIAATVSSAAINPVSLARRVCSMRKIPLFRYGLESAVVLHRGGKRRRVCVRQRAVRNVQRPDARVREAEQVSVRIALRAKEEGASKPIPFNLSGHGMIDLYAYEQYFADKLQDYTVTDAELRRTIDQLDRIIK